MGAWKRWQDWATVLLGVILFATPFIFETTANVAASWTAYVMGALIALVGVYAGAQEEPSPIIEGTPLVLGVALFTAPWALSFTNLPEMAWMAWIGGALVALNATAELLALPQQQQQIAA